MKLSENPAVRYETPRLGITALLPEDISDVRERLDCITPEEATTAVTNAAKAFPDLSGSEIIASVARALEALPIAGVHLTRAKESVYDAEFRICFAKGKELEQLRKREERARRVMREATAVVRHVRSAARGLEIYGRFPRERNEAIAAHALR